MARELTPEEKEMARLADEHPELLRLLVTDHKGALRSVRLSEMEEFRKLDNEEAEQERRAQARLTVSDRRGNPASVPLDKAGEFRARQEELRKQAGQTGQAGWFEEDRDETEE